MHTCVCVNTLSKSSISRLQTLFGYMSSCFMCHFLCACVLILACCIWVCVCVCVCVCVISQIGCVVQWVVDHGVVNEDEEGQVGEEVEQVQSAQVCEFPQHGLFLVAAQSRGLQLEEKLLRAECA